MPDEESLAPYIFTQKLWLVCGTALSSANVVLGAIAILCTTLVASNFPTFMDASVLKWIAAAATSLLAFFDAKNASAKFYEAHNHLSNMVNLFRNQDSDFEYEDVVQARTDGIALITKNTPIPDIFDEDDN